jgi:dTDP-glucose 4,6-dehydratase
VERICDLLDELRPLASGPRRGLIRFVADRPGHDFRYAVDARLLREELDWRPRLAFGDGLRQTVEWYLGNEEWWGPLVDRRAATRRLGLAQSPA